MRSEILQKAAKLALDTPALAMPVLLTEGLKTSKGAAYTRVAVELQLEERETRQKVLTQARHLIRLLKYAETIGLLKKGEYADEGWLNRIPHQSRYYPDPILGILSVLNEHIETLERKVLVWKSYTLHPRCTTHRREIVRGALMGLAPGGYEARFRLRGIEPYKPLEPYNGMDYRNQVDNPQSFNLHKVARVNHAFRLERASEKALARVKPLESAAYTARWWKMRYQKFISDEPLSAHRQRMVALMSKYGIALAEMKPLNLEKEFGRPYEPLELSRTTSIDQKDPEVFDAQEFAKLVAPYLSMGWQELEPGGTMELRGKKSWVSNERSAPLPRRYTPTIEVGDPQIQTAIELLASLSSRLRSFAGFAQIRDLGRSESARQRPSEEVSIELDKPAEYLPSSKEFSVVSRADGTYVFRLARQLDPTVCFDRSRLSVLEVEVCRDPRDAEPFEELTAKLMQKYEAQQGHIASDPLLNDFTTALLTSGRVVTVDNIRFLPSRQRGASFLNLDLADNAILQDVLFDAPSSVLRVRGNSAYFRNVGFGEMAVDLRLGHGSWEGCYAGSSTRMRGSVGKSSFDSRCVVSWDASELDMRSADFDESDLQSRLSGLIARPEMLPASVRRTLSLSRLSDADLTTFVLQQNSVLSRQDVVAILTRLDPRISFYKGRAVAADKQTEGLLTLRRSRDRISIPSGSALHQLCILFGDPAKRLPHRTMLDTFVKTEQHPTRLSADLGEMVEGPAGDSGVLFAALDFFYEGGLRLPRAGGFSIGDRLTGIGSRPHAELVRVD